MTGLRLGRWETGVQDGLGGVMVGVGQGVGGGAKRLASSYC